MIYLKQFLFSFLSTVGFSIIFNVPKKSIFYASLIGGIGWTIYFHLKSVTSSIMFALFIASIVIGILGEIFARIDKKPVTIFVIPGIVPLVPGYGVYLTMLNLINNDFFKFAKIGTETLFSSGAISIGIILVPSLSRLLKSKKTLK
ncbi:threonine/serine exporter family protein [Lutibacter sp. B2]|nr:threonine/serine exporter family protein [Lutibacter sp. B2]